MKIIYVIIALCFSTLYAKDVVVAVASNASYVIKDLSLEFSKTHPDINIKVRLASSGKLYAQILHGAPYALFMSANTKYPDSIYTKNLAKEKPYIYASGALAILSAKPVDLSKGLHLLESTGIKRI